VKKVKEVKGCLGSLGLHGGPAQAKEVKRVVSHLSSS
jgi:hypothetical protein